MNNEPSSYRNHSDQGYTQSPYEPPFSPIFGHNNPASSGSQSIFGHNSPASSGSQSIFGHNNLASSDSQSIFGHNSLASSGSQSIFGHNSPASSDSQSIFGSSNYPVNYSSPYASNYPPNYPSPYPSNYPAVSGDGWQKPTRGRGEVIAISLSVCVAVILFLGGIILFTHIYNRRATDKVAMSPSHLLDNFDVCDAQSALEQVGLSMFTLSDHQSSSNITQLKNEHGEFQVHNCKYVSDKETIEIGKVDLGTNQKVDLTLMKANEEKIRSKFVGDSNAILTHIPNSLDISDFTTPKNSQGLLWIFNLNKGSCACGVSTESGLILFYHTDARIIDMLKKPLDNSISVDTCDKLVDLAKNIT